MKSLGTILFGTNAIDLSALEQLVDTSQTRTMARAIFVFARRYAAEGLSLREGLKCLESDIERNGLDALSDHKVGNLAHARIQEIAAAINRLRTLKVLGFGG